MNYELVTGDKPDIPDTSTLIVKVIVQATAYGACLASQYCDPYSVRLVCARTVVHSTLRQEIGEWMRFKKLGRSLMCMDKG